MEISGKSFHFQLNRSEIFNLLRLKLYAIGLRMVDYFRLIPLRLLRICRHIKAGAETLFQQFEQANTFFYFLSKNGRGIINWWFEMLCFFLELLGVGEIYETAVDWGKFNTRPLHAWEVSLAKEIFGKTIRYQRVRIDEYSVLGPKQKRFCYVSFHIINSWGPMENSVLLHELTHIWQYEKLGAVYMPRALSAQQSNVGYNYGGVASLREAIQNGAGITAFNLEQQGDIVSDYYRLQNGHRPRWGDAVRHDLAVYGHFIRELRLDH